MKNKWIIAAVIAVIVIAAGSLFAIRFFSGGEDSWTCVDGAWVKRGNPSGLAPETGCAPAAGQATPGTLSEANLVVLRNFAFSPASLTVKKGTTVIWKNGDLVIHNVVSTDGYPGFNSSVLSNGEEYRFTFTEKGSYNYYCSIHPSMKGAVDVVD